MKSEQNKHFEIFNVFIPITESRKMKYLVETNISFHPEQQGRYIYIICIIYIDRYVYIYIYILYSRKVA